MKIFLMIFFSIFSFCASAQEKGNKVANPKNSSVKNTKNVVVSKSNDDNLNETNRSTDKKSYPDNVKAAPEEFYIVNDKPVDRVTYLKYLRANKK